MHSILVKMKLFKGKKIVSLVLYRGDFGFFGFCGRWTLVGLSLPGRVAPRRLTTYLNSISKLHMFKTVAKLHEICIYRNERKKSLSKSFSIHGYYSQCYFIHKHLGNAWWQCSLVNSNITLYVHFYVQTVIFNFVVFLSSAFPYLNIFPAQCWEYACKIYNCCVCFAYQRTNNYSTEINTFVSFLQQF